MHANLENFKTGWYGLTLGLKDEEIDKLISALHHLKRKRDHFHFRSKFEGDGGVGDIEFYYLSEEHANNLDIEHEFRDKKL